MGRDIHTRVLRSEKGCRIRVAHVHALSDCVHTRDDTDRLNYASRFVRVIYSSHVVSIKLGTVTLRHMIFITSPLSPVLSSSPPLSPVLSLCFWCLISSSLSPFSVVVVSFSVLCCRCCCRCVSCCVAAAGCCCWLLRCCCVSGQFFVISACVLCRSGHC